MELRGLGQLVQALVAVEVLLVLRLEQPRPRQPALGPAPHDAATHVQHAREEEAPDDAVAHVHLREAHHLRRGALEVALGAAVALPVQHEVRGEDAAARDRRDVGDLGQDARVPQQADHAEVIERCPEPPARQSDADPVPLSHIPRKPYSIPSGACGDWRLRCRAGSVVCVQALGQSVLPSASCWRSGGFESATHGNGRLPVRYRTGRAPRRITETVMTPQASQDERIAKMTFASVYPHYVTRVESKGRTEEELHQVIAWLTGFTQGAGQEAHHETSRPSRPSSMRQS